MEPELVLARELEDDEEEEEEGRLVGEAKGSLACGHVDVGMGAKGSYVG